MTKIWFFGSGKTASMACRSLFKAGYKEILIWSPNKDPLLSTAKELGLNSSSTLDLGVAFNNQPSPEIIISFLCPVYIPKDILVLSQYGGINFHPAPLPRYRGVHCAAFAIRNREREYGVTCHFMTEHFDDGPILGTLPCIIYPEDTETDLENRAKGVLLDLFDLIISRRQWESIAPRSLLWPKRERLYTRIQYSELIHDSHVNMMEPISKRQ